MHLFKACIRRSSHYLRHDLNRELIARINAFWRISQVKILPAYKAAFSRIGLTMSLVVPGYVELSTRRAALFQVRSNQLRRSFHIIQIRTRIIIQRRRHADDDGIRFTD